jgi:starvation-inducible DNA-binding protein
MTKKIKNTSYKKLGYDGIDTAKIVNSLNLLLANYRVHQQNMKNFQWNVKGISFFELNRQFLSYAETANTNIDAIAERIRVFGQQPLSTLAAYLEVAEIKEAGAELDSEMMVRETLKDFQSLLSFMVDVTDDAIDVGDTASEEMINSFIKELEGNHWKLSAWLQKKA